MPLRFVEPAVEAYRPPLTVKHLLAGVLVKAAEQRIVYRDRSSYTYREFMGRIGRLASLLEGVGVQPGTTVAVIDWDSHRYLEAYFAVPMMGAVLQTVNFRLPAPQIAYSLQDAGAEVLLVHHEFFSLAADLLPSLPDVKVVIAIMDGAEGDLPGYAAGEYEALSAEASPDYIFEDFDENAVATTFYTSGTTGNPKAVHFTHRQLVLHTLGTAAFCGASSAAPGLGIDDVYMPLTPMFHVHAWGIPYVATMLGVKQVYPGRYEPKLICDLRTDHKVTYSHCVPTVLQMVIETAKKTGADLTGWKLSIGGSALTKTLCAQGRALGMEIGAGYGMSETCPLVSKATRRASEQQGEALLSTLSAAGIPAPLVDVRIVDDALNMLPHDGQTRGELVIRAPWLTLSYKGAAEATDMLWRGGWLHTQDIATIDPDGTIRIRDRLKDIIKTGGEWIDSIQLEEILATAEGVTEVSVVAVPDAKWGERPIAVVTAEPGAVITLDVLNAPIEAAIAAGRITRYAKLDRFAVVDRLPRTSVGKIDKKALRGRFSSQENSA